VAVIIALLMSQGTLSSEVANADEIAILPARVTLRGPTSNHTLLVQRRAGNDLGEQVNAKATFTSSDEGVVKFRDGKLVPIANGEATVTAQVDAAEAVVEVTVEGIDERRTRSFRHDVQPILAKMGCNSGSCHGALAGKGGLKLSLRGYDTMRDWRTITRQARGRRVELADPGRSLIVAKPSGAMPHKGGLRFDVDSPSYEIITDWIADGARPPTAEDPTLE